jgi:hypothetical protein
VRSTPTRLVVLTIVSVTALIASLQPELATVLRCACQRRAAAARPGVANGSQSASWQHWDWE